MAQHKIAVPPKQKLHDLSSMYQGGHTDDALKLAKAMTRLYPAHPFGWKVLGALHSKAGRAAEALVAYKKLIVLNPDDHIPYNNAASSILIINKFPKEAIPLLEKAIALRPDYPLAHYNLGLALMHTAEFIRALPCFQQAIALQPNYWQAYVDLGKVCFEMGRLEDAYNACQQALALNPNNASVHITLSRVHEMVKGKHMDRVASLKKALALEPDHKEAAYLLGVALEQGADFSGALEQFKAVGGARDSLSWCLRCLYRLDDQPALYELLGGVLTQGITSAMIGNVCCNAELRYARSTPNPFCKDPLNYVTISDLRHQYNFEKICVQPIRQILADPRTAYRVQSRLSYGQQTAGNLFETTNPQIIEIENIIRSEVANYQAQFKGGEEGIIKKFPEEYTLRGWIISMKSGGKLTPHYHEYGWLSGSLYVNVPPRQKEDSGNLVLRQGDAEHSPNIVKEKSMKVDTGSLCLFPSSLEHYTIPFESNEDRILIAFDIL